MGVVVKCSSILTGPTAVGSMVLNIATPWIGGGAAFMKDPWYDIIIWRRMKTSC